MEPFRKFYRNRPTVFFAVAPSSIPGTYEFYTRHQEKKESGRENKDSEPHLPRKLKGEGVLDLKKTTAKNGGHLPVYSIRYTGTVEDGIQER
jgi:hypothetical protein